MGTVTGRQTELLTFDFLTVGNNHMSGPQNRQLHHQVTTLTPTKILQGQRMQARTVRNVRRIYAYIYTLTTNYTKTFNVLQGKYIREIKLKGAQKVINVTVKNNGNIRFKNN
jgi:hypothetical protein